MDVTTINAQDIALALLTLGLLALTIRASRRLSRDSEPAHGPQLPDFQDPRFVAPEIDGFRLAPDLADQRPARPIRQATAYRELLER